MNVAKEKRALEYLKSFQPETEPYYLCYSGGKDSDVIRILAQLSGVKHDIVHNLTTVDAPETIRYIRTIPNVLITYPKETMWQLIVRKQMPPTRLVRYCCALLKEQGGKGRVKITGVRRSESVNRSNNQGLITVIGKPVKTEKTAIEMQADYLINQKGAIVLNTDNDASRRFVEHCYRTTSTMVNPIIDWDDSDVWEFLRYYGCQSNPLYYCGFTRIGCIGCPLGGSTSMKREFALYPKYKENYIRAFDRMLKRREELGKKSGWMSGNEVYSWWIGEDPRQLSLFDSEYNPDWIWEGL